MTERYSFDTIIDQVENTLQLAKDCQERKVADAIDFSQIEQQLREMQFFVGFLKTVNERTLQRMGFKDYADFASKHDMQNVRGSVKKTLERLDHLMDDAKQMQTKLQVQVSQRAIGQVKVADGATAEEIKKKVAKKRQRKFNVLGQR